MTRILRDSGAVRPASVALLLVLACGNLLALKIDISFTDVERALALARSPDPERARFHAQYIQNVDTPFIERAEVISEFRRVVLLAEEQIARGDRFFAYSITRAADALHVWRRRVSVVVRVRFHPQNNYVSAPPVTMAVVGNARALVGVKQEAMYALPPGRSGDFVPVLGAVVEGSFDADALGQARHEFVVHVEGREVGRVSFDLAAID